MSESTREEIVQKAINVFNDVLRNETSNTLDTYWNRSEYVGAMDAAVSVSLPDPSEFMNAVDALIIASENATTFIGRNKRDAAINAIWRLVYGEDGRR